MRAQVASISTEDRAGHRLEEGPLRFPGQIAAQQVGSAGAVFPRPPRAVIEKGGELCVNLVEIAGGILVHDDDIGAQPFQTPVLLCLQDLSHQAHIVVADYAHQQDREITRNAELPEPRLTQSVASNRVRIRPQRAIGEEHSRRETFEQQRLVVRDVQMSQSALGMRECEREGARRRARVAILLCERFGGVAVRRDARGEAEAHRRTREQPDSLTKAENGVEHNAGCARERATVERHRVVRVPTATEESRAIRFPFDRPLRPALEAQDVHGPRSRLSRVPCASMTEERRTLRQVVRLEKQFAERGMRQVIRRGREDDLRVTGDIDFADAGALIDHRQPADLHIVFR